MLANRMAGRSDDFEGLVWSGLVWSAAALARYQMKPQRQAKVMDALGRECRCVFFFSFFFWCVRVNLRVR